MELWNDYEGKTVDGVFPLERLLSPEGRSAFFASKDATGSPAVLRLIESHFDETEILARWAIVSGLKQEHLVEIERAGQATIDGTNLVYALMESPDADLEGILRERPLTVEETKQVGASVVEALVALHGAGLVHEHVEPAAVVAKGEVVKLRSDCVRGAPEGRGGDDLRRVDVQALATLLLQALTQRRQLGAVGGAPLPWPFEEVVRNGMSGAWGLTEMARALVPATPTVPGARPNGAQDGGGAVKGLGGAGGVSATRVAKTAAVPVPELPVSGLVGVSSSAGAKDASVGSKPAPGTRGANGTRPVMGGVMPGISAAAVATGLPQGKTAEGAVSAYTRVERTHAPEAPGRIVIEPAEEAPNRLPLVAGGAVAAVLLAGLGWHFAHRDGAAAIPVTTVTPASQTQIASGPASTAGVGTGGVAVPAPALHGDKPSAVVDRRYGKTAVASAGSRSNWRVVAFTYNREDQAQHKVAQIAEKHGGLRPGVFTPTGQAPYLVTLGGEMTAEQAGVLRNRARKEGLPRDTFARNYRAH